MKKIIIGLTCLALISPGAYSNYKEYKDELPNLAGQKIYSEERSSTSMKKVSYDPGHGPGTSYKVAPNGTPEWKANRKVCDYLAIELKNNGIQGYDVTEGENIKDVPLITRAKRANAWGSDVHISVHHNAMSKTPKWQSTTSGTEAWYTSSEGKLLAKKVQQMLIQELKTKNRGFKDASSHNWTILEATKMPAIIVECEFEDNKVSYALIYKSKDDWFPKACARAICMGICDYFGMQYSSKPYGDSNPVTSSIIPEIKEFQKQEELVVDGIIGPETWGALMAYRESYIDLYKGLDELHDKLEDMKGENT